MTVPSAGEASPVLYATFPRRLLALLVDGLVLLGYLLLLGFVGGLAQLGPYLRGAMLASLLLAVLFYEPLCVAAWGQTIGHRTLNIRVVADTATGRLGFWRAFLRWLLKVPTGVASFATMITARRYQALHDLPFHTTVQVADVSRATEGQFHLERPPLPPSRPPSAVRRVLVTLSYLALSFLVLSVVVIFLLSEECIAGTMCTRGDEMVSDVVGTVWLACAILIVALGWQGRLWGCRRVPLPPDSAPGVQAA